MNAAYDVAPEIVQSKKKFEMPGGIVNRSYCAVSGMAPSEACSKAGLIQSDIFNAKFVPSKVDDSLGSGRYVMANGKSYLALPSTPEEFSETGALIDPDFLKRITLGLVSDFSQIIPDNPRWKGILIADAKLKDDGKAPAGVKASISNDAISWTESPSKDVIGYRIYSSSGQKVASVKSDSKLSHKVGKGGYYVVAVDVAGRESAPSDHVGVEEPEEEEEEEEIV